LIVHDQAPKFVYVDPPKTGTRSTQAWLQDLFPRARDVGDHRQDVEAEWRRYAVFATIRDPYERALSAWASTIREDSLGLGHPDALIRRYGNASPLSFVRWLVDGREWRRANGRIWPLPNQVEFLSPIAAAVGGWKRVALIRLEAVPSNLTRLPFICRRMAARYPHLNKSAGRPRLADQPAAFFDRVNAWAADDFERFDCQRIDPLTRSGSGGATPNLDGPT